MNNSEGKYLVFVSMSRDSMYFWDKLQTFRGYIITEGFFGFFVFFFKLMHTIYRQGNRIHYGCKQTIFFNLTLDSSVNKLKYFNNNGCKPAQYISP